MSRKYRVTVNGREFHVEVGDLAGSPVSVAVDGVTYQVDLADPALGGGPPAPSAVTPAAPTSQPPVSPAVTAPAAPAAGAANAVTAMLPGRILSVQVRAGDTVSRGQPVVVIESMKMEQSIASPRDGVVSRVAVDPGDTVAYGQTLIEFEQTGP